MTRQIKNIKLFSLIIGFILGVLITAIFAGVIYSNGVKDKYILDTKGMAFTALRLNAGKQKEWISHFESDLPGYALAIDQNFADRPGAISALWMLKAYVSRSGMKIPNEIQMIFDSLPEKPPTSCQLRLRELEDKNGEQNVAPNP